jgi:hypothetical protein
MLYQDVRRLVDVLEKASASPDPLQALAAGYEAMASAYLVGEADRRLAQAWVEDLAGIAGCISNGGNA